MKKRKQNREITGFLGYFDKKKGKRVFKTLWQKKR
jgi:hypothetical protein